MQKTKKAATTLTIMAALATGGLTPGRAHVGGQRSARRERERDTRSLVHLQFLPR